MLKAKYRFSKTHPTSLTFDAGDLFVKLPGASADKNWFYVLHLNSRKSGYIPKNYVEDSSEDIIRTLDELEKALKEDKNDHREVLDKIKEARAFNNLENIINDINKTTIKMQEISLPPAAPVQRAVSPQVKPPVVKSVKRTAPKPPKSAELSITTGSSSKKRESESVAQQQRRKSVQHEMEQIQLKGKARELVELIRIQTGLSHSTSHLTVSSVLNFVCEHLNNLDRNVPALLRELNQPLLVEKEDILTSADSKAMEELFKEMTKCKEDDQQRNWMLHEDEALISDNLQKLCSSLQNSDRSVSVHVMSRFKYFYVHSLIEYFQMETRWSLRKSLIEVFILMCSLDSVIISLMLSSVLPLELAQDLYENSSNANRLNHDALLLTVIFSEGEPMPVHYFQQLGARFVDFLLDYIEEPPDSAAAREIPDVFIGLVLSYNLQFTEPSSNVVTKCLGRRSSAKAYTEKILLMLNREEDPSAVLGRRMRPGRPHATRKIIMDMFKDENCYKLFYTNDVYVLIDIIVRQLTDLGGSDEESEDDNPRAAYVQMCDLVLRHTEYSDHLHRFRDLERVFIRILDEEEESKEKDIVIKITKEIDAFESLAP